MLFDRFQRFRKLGDIISFLLVSFKAWRLVFYFVDSKSASCCAKRWFRLEITQWIFFWTKPKSDCNFTFPIDLATNGIPFLELNLSRKKKFPHLLKKIPLRVFFSIENLRKYDNDYWITVINHYCNDYWPRAICEVNTDCN